MAIQHEKDLKKKSSVISALGDRSQIELRCQIAALMTVHPIYGYRRLTIALGVKLTGVQSVMHKSHLKPLRRAKTRSVNSSPAPSVGRLSEETG
jgi:hypothetical protein